MWRQTVHLNKVFLDFYHFFHFPFSIDQFLLFKFFKKMAFNVSLFMFVSLATVSSLCSVIKIIDYFLF